MKTIKILTFLTTLFIFGCSNPLDKLIKPEMLQGAVPNFTITGVDIQTGKSVNGGTLIRGKAIVPYDIKREQVKPTLLSAIKKLQEQHPACQWIVVWLIPEKEAIGAGLEAGHGEYAVDHINIMYGIPSKKTLDREIELKKNLLNPAFIKASIKEDEFFEEMYGPNYKDYVPIRLPTREEFDRCVKIKKLYYAASEEITKRDEKAARKNRQFDGDLYRELMLTQEERVFKSISKQLRMPVSKVKKAKSIGSRYYFLGWDKEKIKIES